MLVTTTISEMSQDMLFVVSSENDFLSSFVLFVEDSQDIYHRVQGVYLYVCLVDDLERWTQADRIHGIKMNLCQMGTIPLYL